MTTIYYAGGEDTSVNFIGSSFSFAVGYRTAFARSALLTFNGTSTADPPANRIQTPTFTAVSNIWIHGQCNIAGTSGSPSNNTTLNEQGILVRSPDGLVRVLLRQTGTAGQLKLTTRNAAGTLTDVSATVGIGVTPSNALTIGQHQFDWNINFASGCVLYWDGNILLNYSGSLETDSATQLNQIDFASFNNSTTATNGAGTNWSEIIVSDSDSRSMSLWTLAPVASGNTQVWTPNTVGNINEVVINDATFVSSSNNGDLSEWTTPTSAPTGIWDVLAIVQEARMRVGTTGPQHFDFVARTGGSDFTFGLSDAPAISFSNFPNNIWATNPNTSAAWQITDIASGFNLGVKALT